MNALSQKGTKTPYRVQSFRIEVVSDLVDLIRSAQVEALKEENLKDEVMVKRHLELKEDSKVLETFKGRIWVPKIGENRDYIMTDAHKSKYSVHPGGTKMY